MCHQPTLSTTSPNSALLAGATQAVTPPGSKGVPSVSDHRAAMSSISAGSPASHALRTPLRQAAARLLGMEMVGTYTLFPADALG